MSTVVVYVHGLWLNGWEAVWLRHTLGQELNCETRAFAYHSVTSDVGENARALGQFLESTPAQTLHLVGHSLGGVIILDLFARVLSPDGALGNGAPLPPGRVVLLGSPVRGSSAAQRLAQLPFGKNIMGLSAGEMLLEPREAAWAGTRDLGVIAGDVPMGLGRLMGHLEGPNDGTVLVEETRIDGATQHLELPVTHSGMVFSTSVARQTAAFLRDGRFEG